MNAEGLALWGGVECTVNRVGACWTDQLALSGHDGRASDLELFKELGVKGMRYPVLWERTAPKMDEAPDFRWADERLNRLFDLGITPIVGLLHHGSGPAYTNLLDPHFPRHFANYAARVAERYPWVRYYVPINEPLTTARFSGLYGLWFPHRRDDVSFARCLINQCRATQLAMRNIRLFNPAAVLVQTEDLGTTHSTVHMRYQRDFDNERRWLTWDLLCGRVTEAHPLYGFLQASGVHQRELAQFVDQPCPPGIIGINHYVTSDRFLDEHTSRHPSVQPGSNGRESYSDVEAVRVMQEHFPGWRILRSAWSRYNLPLALTEVHLGCTREDQMRWFLDAWQAAHRAKRAGCDIRAITAWSLLGSFDWDSLLTLSRRRYEPGAFDVRGPEPRPTALAGLIADLAAGRRPLHPVLAGRGWWHHRPLSQSSLKREPVNRRVLIVGPDGPIRRALVEACRHRDIAIRPCITIPAQFSPSLSARLRAADPWAVIVVAASCGEGRSRSCTLSRRGAASVIDIARSLDCAVLLVSSEEVFSGRVGSPYLESDPPDTKDASARMLAQVESDLLAYERTLCVRSASLFGAGIGDDPVLGIVESPRDHPDENAIISPTYLPDFITAAVDLLIDGCRGLVHLANNGQISRRDFMRLAGNFPASESSSVSARASPGLVEPGVSTQAIKSGRFDLMPTLDDALYRYLQERPVQALSTLTDASAENNQSPPQYAAIKS